MWQEPSDNQQALTAKMTDVVFRIDCRQLRVDHAAALANAVCEIAPQIKDSICSGIHPIHVAGSQNGWERPEDGAEFLLLSRRTRFRVRTESAGAEQLMAELNGVTLSVDGLPLQINAGQVRPLTPQHTLFSRYAYFEAENDIEDESAFVQQIVDHCRSIEFSPTKILCGRMHSINTNEGVRKTRSVMLADVPPRASINLQDSGLGDGRTMGCGLLIPHKDTGAVHDNTAPDMN